MTAPHPSAPHDPRAFLAAGGEMGARMRAHDWSGTTLGDPSGWPQSLRAVLSACLNSPLLGTILWGPDLIMLYNDAYSSSMADRHPAALGRPVAAVRDSAWEQVAPAFHRAMETGEGFMQTDVELPMIRNGRPEITCWNFTAAPIRGEDGRIAGWLTQGVEITEQVRAARRAAGEAERQRLIFQRMPGFVCMLAGPDHRFEYVNDAFIAIAGNRDFINRRFPDVFPELDGHGVDETLDRVYRTGQSIPLFSTRVTLADDAKPHYIDVLVRPIRADADSPITGVLIGGYDTTDRVHAETALRESREFVHRILASSDDCIKVLDLDGSLTFMSEGGQRIMEVCDFNAIQGCPWPDFWTSPHRTTVEHALAAAREGRATHFQGPANTAAGNPRWWDVRVTPILDARGRPERILSISRDITQARHAEQALIELTETLAERVAERTRERDRMWQLSSDIMLHCRFDGIITAVNPAWQEVLEWTEAALVGTNLFDLIHPEDIIPTREAAADLADSLAQIRIDNRYRHRDGTYRWISWSARPDASGIYAVGRDVTAERSKAEALQQAEAALRQSQKMEAVGQLTGGLAHDFNNLLAGISGSLELMQSRMGQGRMGDLERYIGVAQGAARRAASLTHRLLAFSRRQTLDPRPTNVIRLIAEMEELLRRSVGPSTAIEITGAADLWPAMIDGGQLENALLNLCINARDAMPDGGTITIHTENRRIDPDHGAEYDMKPGEYLAIAVTDTGVGMPPDTIARAFEPFFTTKPIGVGTGLGLSMIYGFVRQSGGQVRIESAFGHGTTVTLFLPRHSGDVPLDVTLVKPLDTEPVGQGETVLVVDDEPSVRMLITEVLDDLGYTAIEAADSLAGLKVLQSDIRIDLLITDVGLPGGMNGRQMADAARVARPDLKILFITGYAENAALDTAQLDPGMDVLIKPFLLETLTERIKLGIGSP